MASKGRRGEAPGLNFSLQVEVGWGNDGSPILCFVHPFDLSLFTQSQLLGYGHLDNSEEAGEELGLCTDGQIT